MSINGTIDNDDINYNVIGVGGAAISIAFDEFYSSTSIEVKFFQILNDDDC